MANPLEKVIEVVKRKPKLALIGAGVVGGGLGLITFLGKRKGGSPGSADAGGLAPLNATSGSGFTDSGDVSGGGGGGGGSGDLSSIPGIGSDFSLPGLPELATADLPGVSDLLGGTQAPNFGNTNPLSLPGLADLTSSSYGALPALPELGPLSYSGDDYGNAIGSMPTLLPTSGAVAGFRLNALTPTQALAPLVAQSSESAPALAIQRSQERSSEIQGNITDFQTQQQQTAFLAQRAGEIASTAAADAERASERKAAEARGAAYNATAEQQGLLRAAQIQNENIRSQQAQQLLTPTQALLQQRQQEIALQNQQQVQQALSSQAALQQQRQQELGIYQNQQALSASAALNQQRQQELASYGQMNAMAQQQAAAALNQQRQQEIALQNQQQAQQALSASAALNQQRQQEIALQNQQAAQAKSAAALRTQRAGERV